MKLHFTNTLNIYNGNVKYMELIPTICIKRVDYEMVLDALLVMDADKILATIQNKTTYFQKGNR